MDEDDSDEKHFFGLLCTKACSFRSMKHIAIEETGGSKAAFLLGLATAARLAKQMECAEVLLLVNQDGSFGPGGTIEDTLGRKGVQVLRKGLLLKIDVSFPPLRATTVRKVETSRVPIVVLSAYLDPTKTDEVLKKLGQVSACVHIVWMPEHLVELASTRELETIPLPEK